MYTITLQNAKSAGVGEVAEESINKIEVSPYSASELGLLVHVPGYGLCTIDSIVHKSLDTPNTFLVQTSGGETKTVRFDQATAVQHTLPIDKGDSLRVEVRVDGYWVFVDIAEAGNKDDVWDKMHYAVYRAMDRTGVRGEDEPHPYSLEVTVAVRKQDGWLYHKEAYLGMFYDPTSAVEAAAAFLLVS